MIISPMLIIRTAANEKNLTLPDDTFKIPAFKNKQAMELAHLRHFHTNLQKEHPQYAFSEFWEGSDPPDFEIRRGEHIAGLELTMYTLPKRREQVKFFARIQEKAKELAKSGSLMGLDGIHVEISFGELGGKPSHIGEDVLNELMKEFIELTKRPREPIPLDGDFRNPPYPQGQEGWVGNGSIHWVVATVSNQPFRGSPLADATGFEMTYTHRAHTTCNQILDHLQNCINSKDKPGADELLISVGAPDTDGWLIFAESRGLTQCMEAWEGRTVPPKHLKRIFVDIWGQERIFVIHDEDGRKD